MKSIKYSIAVVACIVLLTIVAGWMIFPGATTTGSLTSTPSDVATASSSLESGRKGVNHPTSQAPNPVRLTGEVEVSLTGAPAGPSSAEVSVSLVPLDPAHLRADGKHLDLSSLAASDSVPVDRFDMDSGTTTLREDIPPGNYRAIVGAASAERARSAEFAVRAGERTAVRVVLPRTTPFSLRALRPDGTPASGVELLLLREPVNDPASPRSLVIVDIEGTAGFPTAPEGYCLLFRRTVGGLLLPLRSTIHVPKDEGRSVTVPGEADLTLELETSAGAPLADTDIALVANRPWSFALRGRTDGAGRVRFPEFPWSVLDHVTVLSLEVRRNTGPPLREDGLAPLLRWAAATRVLRYRLLPRHSVRLALEPFPMEVTSVRVDQTWRTAAFSVDRSADFGADAAPVLALEPGRYRFRVTVESAGGISTGSAETELGPDSGERVVTVPLQKRDLCTLLFLRDGKLLKATSARLVTGEPGAGSGETRSVPSTTGSRISLVLPPEGAWVSGTVTDDSGGVHIVDAEIPPGALDARIPVVPGGSIAGVVREGAGDTVPGVVISARIEGLPPRGWDRIVPEVATDESGYALEGLPAGEWRLRARRRTSTAPGGAGRERVVTVKAGETTRYDIEFDDGFDLRGRVVDDAGAPLDGIIVQAVPGARGDGPEPTAPGFVDMNTRGGTTDRDGRFALHGLETGGPWDIVLTGAGLLPHRATDCRAGAEEILLTVRRGVVVGLRLRLPGSVDPAGLYVMLEGVRDASGKDLDYRSAMLSHVAITPTRDGFIELPPLPEGGGATISVQTGKHPPGVSIVRRMIVMDELREGVRELDLTGTGDAVAGRVIDAVGEPVAFALVGILPAGADGKATSTVVTDRLGNFRIVGLAPRGSATYGAYAPDCPHQSGAIENLAGSPQIVLVRGRRIHGIVVNSRGTPVAGALVSPLPTGVTVFSDFHGAFELVVSVGTGSLVAQSGGSKCTVALPADDGPLRLELGAEQR